MIFELCDIAFDAVGNDGLDPSQHRHAVIFMHDDIPRAKLRLAKHGAVDGGRRLSDHMGGRDDCQVQSVVGKAVVKIAASGQQAAGLRPLELTPAFDQPHLAPDGAFQTAAKPAEARALPGDQNAPSRSKLRLDIVKKSLTRIGLLPETSRRLLTTLRKMEG